MNAKSICRLSICFFALLVASAVAVSSATASNVSFSAWDGTDANSGIGTPGQGGPLDVGLAVNWDGPATSVNGVPFAASTTGHPGPYSGTVGGISYKLSGTDSEIVGSGNDHLNGGVNTANTSYQLATNFFYSSPTVSGPNGGSISSAVETLTLTGLSPNETYTFVEYTSNWGSPRVQNFTDSLGGSLSFDEDANPKGSMLKDVYNTGASSSVTFTFTADPNGQPNNGSMHEYAFSNFATTPEPSSFVLGGLGVVGLLLAARRRRKAATLLSILAVVALTINTGRATTITTLGPNTYTDTGVDTAGSGPRGNIDIASAITLPAGTYGIDTFKFAYAASGDAQPFLATVSGTAGSGSETYTVIAAGSDAHFTYSGTGNDISTVAFGGLPSFTLAVPTTVYAGFNNVSSDNTITTDGGGTHIPGTDAHFAPGPEGVSIGTQLIEQAATLQGTGGTYELSRHYDFAITVQSPEPSSFVLGGLGVAGLLFAARRRRKG